jgi:hypothetical protein
MKRRLFSLKKKVSYFCKIEEKFLGSDEKTLMGLVGGGGMVGQCFKNTSGSLSLVFS